MKSLSIFRKLYIGFQRNPKRFLNTLLFTFATLWTFLEPVLGLLNLNLKGINEFILFLLASLIIGLVLCIPTEKISFKLKSTNTKVTIAFGDLFSCNGFIAIPVSQYFYEGKLEELVSSNSLQGILIKKFYHSKTDYYLSELNKALKDEKYGNDNTRQRGNEKKYKIGTTIRLSIPEKNDFLIFAITKTELQEIHERNKNFENATPKSLWIALEGLLNKAKSILDGNSLNLPLIGSGISGIGLPALRILELNLLCILTETKKSHITNEIRIIIHPNYYEEIDLVNFKKIWE